MAQYGKCAECERAATFHADDNRCRCGRHYAEYVKQQTKAAKYKGTDPTDHVWLDAGADVGYLT